MQGAPITGGGLLDSAGRQLVQLAEYRIVGLAILLLLAIFAIWRRWKFGSWPIVEECFAVFTTVLGIVGAFIVGAVFLLTKPPAVDLLSPQALLIIGVAVPVMIFGYTFPRLRALFWPAPPGAPPVQPTGKEDGA